MNTSYTSFAFWGTPELSAETLSILKDSGYIPKVIITTVDTRSGRGMEIHESPVSVWANKNNIPVLKPIKIDDEFRAKFSSFNIDLSIVVAYGKILPKDIIDAPRLGTINIHYSLLPKYRGASPLEQALLSGDSETGVSIQQMEHRLDSGPIIAEQKITIDVSETKDILRSRLTKIGAELTAQIIPEIINGTIHPHNQDESRATYCSKISKEDGAIDPNGDAILNWNKYRAFWGWPGVYFFTERNGVKIRVKITRARFENNLFVIEKVIPEGKKEINYSDFLKQK